MNRVARGLLVNIGAAAAGSLAATLVMITIDTPPIPGSSWERLGMAIITVPFTLFGSFAVLTPAYLWLSRDMAQRIRYLGTSLAGAIGGAIILALLFGLDVKASAIGAFYGLTTALMWIGLHRATAQQVDSG